MGRWLTALPFRWEPSSRELIVTKDSVTYTLYATNVYFIILSIHIGDCFVWGVFSGRNISNLSVDAILMVSWFIFGLWQVNVLWRRHEFADIFNQVMRFDKINTSLYSNLDDRIENATIFGRKTDGCDVLITWYNFFVILWSLMCAILFIQKPDNPRYIFHRFALDSSNAYYPYFSFLWFLWEWFNQFRAAIIFHFYLYLVLVYTNSTNFWLQKLSRPNSKKVKHSPVLYKLVVATKSIRNYKTQQILNVKFNDCCSKVFWPSFKFYNIFNHILSIYVMVKFHEQLPRASFASFPVSMVLWLVIEFVFYPLLGKINDLSIAYIYSWKSQLGTGGRRHFDALTPLGVRVGSSYTIKKSTVLTVSFIICTMTMNLIVGF
ncbi:unnamed protein product [Allacma fusca]|uniref:Uncharacterized protein n=1 Tax=Allacma fusca TaxID=39272 RepID=A0A8J2KN86_9HEXA|nr:unnamed protein product [Allacma fusca]